MQPKKKSEKFLFKLAFVCGVAIGTLKFIRLRKDSVFIGFIVFKSQFRSYCSTFMSPCLTFQDTGICQHQLQAALFFLNVQTPDFSGCVYKGVLCVCVGGRGDRIALSQMQWDYYTYLRYYGRKNPVHCQHNFRNFT